MKQNTFKSLSSRLSYDNILPEFKAIFRKLRPDLLEQADWNIYRDIYQALRTHEIIVSKYSIQIFECWEKASYPGSNCCVGYEDGDDYDYRAIGGYHSLSEILGMEITISNDATLTPQELAAGLLWEITYAKRNGLADLDTEHLTFGYLLTRFNFDDILPDFKHLYQKNAPGSFQDADWEAYRKVYQNLQNHEVSESRYIIYLASRWEGCSPMIDMNCSVYDKEADEIFQPMATYIPLSEILGMDINIEHDIVITPQELTAGLFWEITYYGRES